MWQKKKEGALNVKKRKKIHYFVSQNCFSRDLKLPRDPVELRKAVTAWQHHSQCVCSSVAAGAVAQGEPMSDGMLEQL